MNLDELLRAAITDASKRSLFLQTLIKSNVYVICKNPAVESSDGIKLELITIHNPQNEMFIPFFTSKRALQQFAKRYVEYYKINCLRLFDLIQTQSAVLNPNSYGKEFSSDEIKSIIMIARKFNIKAISLKEEDTFTYRPPQREVTHITRPTSRFLAKHMNVERAFIVDMIQGCESPRTLVVLDMMGNTRKLFVPLSKYLSKITKPSDQLCFISYEQEMGKNAAAVTEPFYIRKKRYFEK